MAKIVYGFSGEGSGHSSRSREMAAHLRDRGHQLRLVSYDRGYRNLKDEFDVFETEGLSIASEDNRVSLVKTFTDNIRRLPEGHRKLNELRKSLFKEFQQDCVITDFEPMTAYLANHYSLPLITIDNQHRMRYMKNHKHHSRICFTPLVFKHISRFGDLPKTSKNRPKTLLAGVMTPGQANEKPRPAIAEQGVPQMEARIATSVP